MKITDKVKNYEDACQALGLNPLALPDVCALPEKDREYVISNYKLVIITRALNEGWEPNWNDDSEYKYFPWFEVDADDERPAGFGFSGTFYDSWITYSTVGSRLCFKSSELALYAGKQFEELYIKQQLITG